MDYENPETRTHQEPALSIRLEDLPANVEAEQAFLGALFQSNRVYDRVSDLLTVEHFANRLHRTIYRTCLDLMASGHKANPVSLRPILEENPDLHAAGGTEYLSELAASVVTLVNTESYARQIIEAANRRMIIKVAEDAIAAASNGATGEAGVKAAVDAIASSLDGILTSRGERQDRSLAACLDDARADWIEAAKRKGPTGIMTGLKDLDRILCGMKPGELHVFAGRPAMGKTALTCTIALNVAKAGKSVGLWSLEMSGKQLAKRVYAAEAGIPTDIAEMGGLTDDDFNRIDAAIGRLERLPLRIDDFESLTVQTLRARAKQMKRRFGLDLIMLDYIGLLNSDGRTENRTQEVAQQTKALKQLASELQVPVIILSQLNRAVETREDKRPMLADLRDSGSVEQDANSVNFLYREEYYLQGAEPKKKATDSDEKYAKALAGYAAAMERCRGIAEIIVAKNRSGRTGTVTLNFNGASTKFENLWKGGTL